MVKHVVKQCAKYCDNIKRINEVIDRDVLYRAKYWSLYSRRCDPLTVPLCTWCFTWFLLLLPPSVTVPLLDRPEHLPLYKLSGHLQSQLYITWEETDSLQYSSKSTSNWERWYLSLSAGSKLNSSCKLRYHQYQDWVCKRGEIEWNVCLCFTF